MAKIAIDVVLLPPEEIMDKAIEINNQFKDDLIKLNKENCLPHISLCIGVVEEEDLVKIKEIIDGIVTNFSKLSLTINRINSEYTGFDIKKEEELQRLHETIMKRLNNYLSYDATIEMCYSPPSVVEKTLFWINNYKEKFGFDNFQPHITLGTSKIEDKEVEIKFTCSRLAVCHLGDHCTCRKILYEVKLQ